MEFSAWHLATSISRFHQRGFWDKNCFIIVHTSALRPSVIFISSSNIEWSSRSFFMLYLSFAKMSLVTSFFEAKALVNGGGVTLRFVDVPITLIFMSSNSGSNFTFNGESNSFLFISMDSGSLGLFVELPGNVVWGMVPSFVDGSCWWFFSVWLMSASFTLVCWVWYPIVCSSVDTFPPGDDFGCSLSVNELLIWICESQLLSRWSSSTAAVVG